MLNKVILIGRLTKDPELKHTASNIAVANFSLAVNRPFTDQSGERGVDFINIIVWRKQAENVKKYLNKGSLISLEGRIQTRNYENSEGKKVYVTEVVADSVQFLESKGQKSNVSPQDFVDKESVADVDVADPYADFGDSIEISDDDLPF